MITRESQRIFGKTADAICFRLANANVYLQSFLWIFVNEAIGEVAKAKGETNR